VPARVVVVGSVNVDLVVAVEQLPAAGETVTGGRFAQHGGGKSANQAVAAARLGADVAFVGAIGDDAMGEGAVAALAAEGIDVSGVARLDAPTGVALIVVDAAGENQIAVASGANAAFTLAELDLTGDGVVLLGNEVSDEVVERAARAANAAGWPVVLNPAPARALPDAALAVITPNASEAAQLTGEEEPEAAARVLVEQTGAAVLVTRGARGALLLEPGGEPQRLDATEVDVVDTTGAGDTVNGALAAELAEGRSLADAARFALRAAALSTTAPGARGGMPRRAEVDA
jgi:ribokinase